MNTSDAKEYLTKREIPQLFESLLTGLMYHRPEDPIDYLESCLKKVRELGGPDKVRWDTFVGQEKKSLPPLNGGQSRRSFFRNVLPDSPSFPYRRYDRLPPIPQFSIESDSDLSETAELIEEYEVFDPSRPRPKVVLIIGGPGSGKGTQSLKIAERYGFEYVSVGELLRKKMIHNATSNRKWSLIARIITNGELAPQETTITEIKQKIMKIPDANGIVIDGFPRDVGQALSFEDQICTPDLVVFLSCSNQRLKERLEKRAEQQGRPDDNPKATERRLTNFKQNAIPLVRYFQEKGLVVTLDADRDEEEVFYDISMTVDNRLFPTKEPVAGPSELDLSLLVDSASLADVPSRFDEQAEEEEGCTEQTVESFPIEKRRPRVIFVIGGPGSGKALQCERIEERYGLRRLCPGDILCSELQSHSERGRFLRDLLERGQHLPEDTLLDLLRECMESTVRQGKGFLVSGFPRDLRQAEEFEAKMGQPCVVLLLDCSVDTMNSRLQQRTCSSLRSGEARGRDTRHRVEGFCDTVTLVTRFYEHRALLHRIDAEQPPDEVFEQICLVLDSC
ncbi:adenylate kinase isoenzyme 5 [Electrophorus electricus]|uniref:adenylate kinase isoenzyme 5 n=1 Tax=Electrophorus electricus TaxID=8005 RepID=UPI0015D0A8ED|nr:adenylate kinase isoenzyme 5 [Electrophorus electricus]